MHDKKVLHWQGLSLLICVLCFIFYWGLNVKHVTTLPLFLYVPDNKTDTLSRSILLLVFHTVVTVNWS